jgi:hypothetical protein
MHVEARDLGKTDPSRVCALDGVAHRHRAR